MAKMRVAEKAIARVYHTLLLTAGSAAVVLTSLNDESRNMPASGAIMNSNTSEASIVKIQLNSVFLFIIPRLTVAGHEIFP
jgi:hypothetical protein